MRKELMSACVCVYIYIYEIAISPHSSFFLLLCSTSVVHWFLFCSTMNILLPNPVHFMVDHSAYLFYCTHRIHFQNSFKFSFIVQDHEFSRHESSVTSNAHSPTPSMSNQTLESLFQEIIAGYNIFLYQFQLRMNELINLRKLIKWFTTNLIWLARDS